MKRLLLFLIILSILLAACLSQTTDATITTETSKTDITKTPLKIEKTPTNTPTIAPTLTETKEETEAVVETQPVEEPTSTPTEQAKEAELTPTIESMFSKHPEYKDFSDSENSINKYVEAVRMTGLEISPEEVLTNLLLNIKELLFSII